MVQGILLDVDGTLLLSNQAHARAWVKAFEKSGRKVEYDQLVKLMGMGGDVLLPHLFPDLSASEGEGKRISDDHKAIFLEEYLDDTEPAPGVRDLIEYLDEAEAELMVATSSSQRELDGALEQAGLADVLTEAATGDDAEKSKPAADVVALALAKLDLPAEEVIMIGDSPYDIQAADKVGVGLIALRCGGYTDDELEGALEIYDDPADLLVKIDTSILGSDF